MTNDPYVSPDEGTIVLIVSLPQWPPKAATSIVPPQDLGGVVTHEVKALPSGILSFHTTSVTGVNVTLRSCPVTLNGSGYVKIVSHYSHQGGTSIIDGHCVASTETGYKPLSHAEITVRAKDAPGHKPIVALPRLRFEINQGINLANTRLYSPMRDFCASSDAFAIAERAFRGHPPQFTDNDYFLHSACAIGYSVAISGLSVFKAAMLQLPNPDIHIVVTDKTINNISQENKWIKGSLKGVRNLFEDSISAQFLVYYESYIGWIKNQASYDKNNYQPTWNFARVVRNAIVHGGTINIKDKEAKHVEWHGIIYDHSNFGQRVLGQSMHVTDIIILMLEMDTALTDMGYVTAP